MSSKSKSSKKKTAASIPTTPSPSLSDVLEDQRQYVTIHEKAPKNVRTMENYGLYGDSFENGFNIDEWKANLKIKVLELNEEKIVFEMIGVDAPIANALRRILLSSVPTMAIGTVYIVKNTSIIPDEVIAHRLGLIPINANPDEFEFRENKDDPESYTDSNTICFRLSVKCERIPGSKDDDPEHKKYQHSRVTSADLIWTPQGEQAQTFENRPLGPVFDDLVIAKLRPGQEIELHAYCDKGVAEDHAKWSPVATATYQLLPKITIKSQLSQTQSEQLVKLCPANVFDIEDGVAIAARPRDCTFCRECVRDDWANHVLLQKVKNHFIFSIESVGILAPEVIVQSALKVLISKITQLSEAYKESLSTPSH